MIHHSFIEFQDVSELIPDTAGQGWLLQKILEFLSRL